MDHLATISGTMLVLSVKLLQINMHAHVITLVPLNLSRSLAATTTVNQAIQPKIGKVEYFQTTSYGMESSVVMKAYAALVPTLHNGSV